MAQYKSFAPKGSFSDFQIAVPDQTQQIEKETVRQMRGKQAAQNFKEENEKIYINALKLKFSKEEQQRDDNFEAKIQNLKANQDFNREKFAQQIEAEKSIAQQKAKGLKDLASLSKTALSTYAQIDESFKKSERAALHQIALESGLNFEDLQSIRGIQNKLTKAQFNQIEFIQRKITEGATPAQINALYRAYQKSGSSQWVNVTSVYQQSALSHSAYMDQALKDWFTTFEGQPQQPTIEQINAKVASINAEFIESKFTGGRREVLESSGVYNQIRTNTRTLLKGFHETNSKEIAQRLKDERFKGFTNTYKTGGGMAAVVGLITSARSRQSRDELFEWMETGLATGALKVDDVHNAINQRFDQDQSLAERFPNSEGIARVMKAIRQQGTILRQNYAISEDLRQAEVAQAAYDILNAELATGLVREKTFRAQEEALLIENVNPNVLDRFKPYLADTQTSNYADQRFEDRYNRSGILPTIEELDNYTGLTAEVRNKWEAKIKERNSNPIVKDHIKAIRNQVRAAPQIQALGSATASGTVAIMESRRIQSYYRNAAKFGYDQALAMEIENIQKIQADPAAFDARGNYTVIMNELASDRAKAKVNAAALNDAIDVIKKTPTTRRDFKELSNAMGASVVYGNLGNLNNGRPTSAMFNNIANKLNMTPYALAKTLDKAGNLDILKGPLWDRMEKLAAEPNIGLRLRTTFPTRERVNRANTLDNRSGQTAPVRGSDLFKFRAAIINKESGGNYTTVNPDSGAIGIGQVMPDNVAPWTQKYLGRTLTPEEFRYNPGAQDAVVNGRFKDMLADQRAAGYTGELMIRRAASVWYSGKPDLWNDTRQQWYNGRSYPSIAEYTQSIWNMFQISN